MIVVNTIVRREILGRVEVYNNYVVDCLKDWDIQHTDIKLSLKVYKLLYKMFNHYLTISHLIYYQDI